MGSTNLVRGASWQVKTVAGDAFAFDRAQLTLRRIRAVIQNKSDTVDAVVKSVDRHRSDFEIVDWTVPANGVYRLCAITEVILKVEVNYVSV